MAFRSLKYNNVGKFKKLRQTNANLDQKQCFLSCKFSDWDTKEVCGFAIFGLIITNLRICDLWTGPPRKFADLRLRTEPKNLRICRQKKFACPPLPGRGVYPAIFILRIHKVRYRYPTQKMIQVRFLCLSGEKLVLLHQT